ncbi:tyrosine-type recombinase/integrase [Alphaproteobacteria bacterium LSUCC0684]
MKINLTPARIKRLRPNTRDQVIWDRTVPHFGIRIRTSGAMRYVHMAMQGGRLVRTTLGDVRRMSLDDARAAAADLNARITPGIIEPVPLFKDFAWQVWWATCEPHHKPGTKARHRQALLRHLIPAFGDMRLDAITRPHILNWFDRYSRRYPGSANRVMDVLKAILNHAVRTGVLARNPARGITPNPKRKMTRFLSDDERSRLLNALDRVRPKEQVQADLVRMLLFTGCRKGEILNLRWDEVHGSILTLSDSKTGPRTIWLGDETMAVLERQRRRKMGQGEVSDFVFPHPHDVNRGMGSIDMFWRSLRQRIGLVDVRLHDLRHTFASQAMRQGIALPVISKLLEHSSLAMTMRYTHLGNADIEAAAERIGAQIDRQLNELPQEGAILLARQEG